ncbi:hypothetical protein RHMOL_Rhmol06G0082000 [Rhododendron molle]|uniref:Uncharacterized protein n=1 Tax=Rhododendron molle TaxID=49168 RepID=A0ACC0NB85_RHOML|nr:hypothetical protein RHMOL_Rhmol06G0082000 [Rhododendron molle]
MVNQTIKQSATPPPEETRSSVRIIFGQAPVRIPSAVDLANQRLRFAEHVLLQNDVVLEQNVFGESQPLIYKINGRGNSDRRFGQASGTGDLRSLRRAFPRNTVVLLDPVGVYNYCRGLRKAMENPLAASNVENSLGDFERSQGAVHRATGPAKNWIDAITIGNGRLGAMVWGSVAYETLNLKVAVVSFFAVDFIRPVVSLCRCRFPPSPSFPFFIFNTNRNDKTKSECPVVGEIVCSALDKFVESKLGLPIWFTELDLSHLNERFRGDDLEVMLREVFAHPAGEGIMFWGNKEGKKKWNNAHWWNANGDLNEAGRRLLALKEEWMSNEKGKINQGQFKFRGFQGDYKVDVQISSNRISKVFEVPRGESPLVVPINL